MEHSVNFYASLWIAMIAHVFLLHGGLQAVGFDSPGDDAAQSVRKREAFGKERDRVVSPQSRGRRLAKALAIS